MHQTSAKTYHKHLQAHDSKAEKVKKNHVRASGGKLLGFPRLQSNEKDLGVVEAGGS